MSKLPEPFRRIKPLDSSTAVPWWQLELVLEQLVALQERVKELESTQNRGDNA